MIDRTPEKIAEIVEFAEADAGTSLSLCAPPEFARLTRMEVKRFGSVRVSALPALDHPLFNRIVGLGVGEPATESVADDVIAFFQNAGCRNFMAQVSPLAQPAQCPEWLAARGFKPGANWAKMIRGNEPAPRIATDLRVELIGEDHAEAYANVVLATFEMPALLRPLMKGIVGQPGWRHYLAFAGEKPVSVASMFVNGEVGWIGNMGTLKTYRRRGAQGAMFARCIQDGPALGCKWFVTETGEETPANPNPSYHNMLRNGFQLAYLRRNYLHLRPLSPVNAVRRALFVAVQSSGFAWRRLRDR